METCNLLVGNIFFLFFPLQFLNLEHSLKAHTHKCVVHTYFKKKIKLWVLYFWHFVDQISVGDHFFPVVNVWLPVREQEQTLTVSVSVRPCVRSISVINCCLITLIRSISMFLWISHDAGWPFLVAWFWLASQLKTTLLFCGVQLYLCRSKKRKRPTIMWFLSFKSFQRYFILVLLQPGFLNI